MSKVFFSYSTRNKSGKKNVISTSVHNRSTCAIVVFPWQSPEITNLFKQDASSQPGSQNSSDRTFIDREPSYIINDVVACNVSKNKSNPSGSFSVTLKRGKERSGNTIKQKDVNYLELIHPGDWIAIYIKRGLPYQDKDLKRTDKNSGLRMIGIVENVRYIEVEQEGGSPRLEYIVTGKDFGKVFESNIFFNPHIAPIAQVAVGMNILTNSSEVLKDNRNKNTIGMDAGTAIKRVVGFYLGSSKGQGPKDPVLPKANTTHQAWYIPPSLSAHIKNTKKEKGNASFVDILNMSNIGILKYDIKGEVTARVQLRGGTIPLALPTSGTIWATMEFLQNKVLNEMYTDLTLQNGKLVPSLILRQYPFSNEINSETCVFNADELGSYKDPNNNNNEKTIFTSLPRVSILSSDIKQKNVGKSDFERINHVLVTPQNPVGGSNLELAFRSILNTSSIQRHGIRSFITYTNHIFSENKENFISQCEKATALLADWFFMSHLLYNGTISVQGLNDHLELGNNLYIKDLKQLYHIEGYSYSFTLGSNGTASYDVEFSVSRGQTYGDNLSGFIGPTKLQREPTTITYSTTEGRR